MTFSVNVTWLLAPFSSGSKRITAGGARYQRAALSPLQALHQPLPSASQQTDFSALFPFSAAPFNVLLSVNNYFRSKLNSKPIVDQHIDLQEELIKSKVHELKSFVS